MSLISSKELEQFEELGYFVTEPQFSDALLATVKLEFDRLWELEIHAAEKSGHAPGVDLARNRPFIGQAHTRSDVLAEFVKEPIYLEACEKLVGPNADLYYNQVVIKSPERGKHFGWHQDSAYLLTDPMKYITCWTAITRTYVDNGCIWVLPKSHKRGLIEHFHNEADSSHDAILDSEEGAVPVEMKPGQVAIFSSLTLHKSGPNISRDVRYGYVPQYQQPGVVRAGTHEPVGDLFPVLRDGKRAD